VVTLTQGAPEPVFDKDYWDGRYRSRPVVWSGRPNPHLIAEASGLVPGTAADIGAGEGADACWLAEQGWRVTAVDLSTVALERAADHARGLGAEIADRISWQQADLAEWSPPEGGFDLVSAHFIQLPTALREPVYAGLAAAVAPGGTLLIVGHHPSDLESGVPRPPLPDLFFTAGQIAAALAPSDWEVLVEEARPRTAKDSEGRDAVVHDAVLRARRV
jgi:SAM-dependent methyltransferase